jgi:hypothetical protein
MIRKLVVLMLLALVGAGCARLSRIVGPKSVPVDRQAYLEALNQSWKEQLLFNLVKLRYGDAPTFLDVSSISQSYRLDTGATAGYTYSGQLSKPGATVVTQSGTAGNTTTTTVPSFPIPTSTFNVGGTVTYDINPTISYTPISGEAFKKALIAPIPITDLFPFFETAGEVEIYLPLCVKSINNLRNRSVLYPGDPKFFRLVTIWTKLREKGAIHVTIKTIKEPKETPEEGDETSKEHIKRSNLPAPQHKLVANLVEFTSALVQKQKKKDNGDDEGAEAVVISLNENPAPDLDTKVIKEIRELVIEFKTILGLPLVDLNTGPDSELNKVFSSTLKQKWGDQLTIQKITEGRPYTSLDDLKKVGLKKTQIKLLKNYLSVGNDFQVVSGQPPQKTKEQKIFEKIYVTTRSVNQTLIYLSRYITVPPGDNNQTWPRDEFPEKALLHKLKIESGDHRPNDAFVALKYHDHWFWINGTDLTSKRIFSDMIVIFTMMERGNKYTPILTLPVR